MAIQRTCSSAPCHEALLALDVKPSQQRGVSLVEERQKTLKDPDTRLFAGWSR
jgi:hypothetical protein